jgi:hypothetical protein
VNRVYLLWHQHQDNDDTAKLLGVYSSREGAAGRIDTARLLPGFQRYPDSFEVAEYVVDKDEWTAGFATMDAEGNWVDDSDTGRDGD